MKADLVYCAACHRQVAVADLHPDGDVCYDCAWHPCKHCGMSLRDHTQLTSAYKCLFDATYFWPMHRIPDKEIW